MKFTRILSFAGVMSAALACFTATSHAQPLYDKVIVDLPYTVTLGDKTLPPGHYVIRQMDDAGTNSRVLQIFSNEGMKLDATVITIPTVKLDTPEKTRVVLHHYGSDFYFDKVWVQGKTYGYEFPLPRSVKAREKERQESYTVAAKYEGANQQEQQTQTAEAAPPPAPEPAPAPEAQPAPAPAPEPAPAPAPETNTMPTTADGWGIQVAAGVLLAIAGLLLRRVTA